MVRFFTVFLMVAAIGGCCHIRVGARKEPAISGSSGAEKIFSDADCQRLLERRDRAELAGKILTGAGGIGALGAAPDRWPEGARWGIAAGAAGLSAAGLAVWWYAGRKNLEFIQYCEVHNE